MNNKIIMHGMQIIPCTVETQPVTSMFCLTGSFNKYLPVQPHGFSWLIQHLFCQSEQWIGFLVLRSLWGVWLDVFALLYSFSIITVVIQICFPIIENECNCVKTSNRTPVVALSLIPGLCMIAAFIILRSLLHWVVFISTSFFD